MFKPSIIIVLLLLSTTEILGQFKVMLSDSYPPFNYKNKKGELVGFNIDIIHAIKKMYNYDIEISSGSWHAINTALENGEIQAIGGAHYPGTFGDDYIYTRSAINTSHCFFYNKNTIDKLSIEELRSIKKPRIGLWENDVLKHYILSVNPFSELLYVKNYEDMLNLLDREDVTCIIGQRIGGMYYANKMEKKYIHASGHRILERNMGFKVSKNNSELAEILNNGLEVLLSSGEYQRIYNKWISPYDKDKNDWSYILKPILISGSIILFLFLLLLFFNKVLHNKVRKRTKDLQKQLMVNAEMVKELEQQKTRAQESERIKSAFLANMSHEIRTPMNGILGFADLLKSQEYSKEEELQFISVIKQSGNRMLNTINNIIDVSKLESGAEKIKISKIDIDALMNEIKLFFTPEANSKKLKLLFEKSGDKNMYCLNTDEYKLNSILINLIKNALKFTHNGYVKISYCLSEKEANFIISDTGVGIAENKQTLIFNQFEQGSNRYSSGFEGSGLGLSITKGYVRLLNGSIQLKSEIEKGSTFYVKIPNTEIAESK